MTSPAQSPPMPTCTCFHGFHLHLNDSCHHPGCECTGYKPLSLLSHTSVTIVQTVVPA